MFGKGKNNKQRQVYDPRPSDVFRVCREVQEIAELEQQVANMEHELNDKLARLEELREAHGKAYSMLEDMVRAEYGQGQLPRREARDTREYADAIRQPPAKRKPKEKVTERAVQEDAEGEWADEGIGDEDQPQGDGSVEIRY